MSLVEIGPRLVLNPVRVFSGSFGGRTLHMNSNFVPPSMLRRMLKAQKASKYTQRAEEEFMRDQKKKDEVLPEDERDAIFH
jgi:ribosome biogenesis protein BRX1